MQRKALAPTSLSPNWPSSGGWKASAYELIAEKRICQTCGGSETVYNRAVKVLLEKKGGKRRVALGEFKKLLGFINSRLGQKLTLPALPRQITEIPVEVDVCHTCFDSGKVTNEPDVEYVPKEEFKLPLDVKELTELTTFASFYTEEELERFIKSKQPRQGKQATAPVTPIDLTEF